MRSSANVLPEGRLQYSIQSRISCREPLPTLPARYGSAPISRHTPMNSRVHKLPSPADPLPHLPEKMRRPPHHRAKADEFVGTKAAVLHVPAPMNIDALRPALRRSDAVPPMIIIRITAARPSQYGD